MSDPTPAPTPPVIHLIDQASADALRPGWHTSEGQMVAGALVIINAILATFLALVANGTLSVPGNWVAIATSVDAIITAVLPMGYASQRTSLKVAALSGNSASNESDPTP